jgi:ferredoxin
MNLLRLTPIIERFAAATAGAPLRVESDRCLHHWNRDSACQQCVNICPTQALSLTSDEIALDESVCVQCGACLPCCPTGALIGFDERARLLQFLTELPPSASVDLACGVASMPLTDPSVDVILQVGGCLAGLGPAAYVGLAALGVERVGLHLEGCAACPIGGLRSQIVETIDAANALTDLNIVVVAEDAGERTHKQMHSTRSRRYSRRALLRRFAGGGSPSSAVLPDLEPPPENGKAPPLERRALLHALAHLYDARRTSAHFFPSMTASSSCTACRVCATVCPTGALSFESEEGCFSLTFAPKACTECGLCVELCAADALRSAAPLSYNDAEPYVLLQGRLKKCKRCRVDFCGESDLCPTCTFRRRHPSGSTPRPL